MGNPDRAEERPGLDGYAQEKNNSWADVVRSDNERTQNIKNNILFSEEERTSMVKSINTALNEISYFDHPSNSTRYNILNLAKTALQNGNTNTILSLQIQLNQCGRELKQAGISSIAEDHLFWGQVQTLISQIIESVHYDFSIDRGEKQKDNKADTSDGSSLPKQTAQEYSQIPQDNQNTQTQNTENTNQTNLEVQINLENQTNNPFAQEVYSILGNNTVSQTLVKGILLQYWALKGVGEAVVDFARFIKDILTTIPSAMLWDKESQQAIWSICEGIASSFATDSNIQGILEKANINPIGNTDRQLAYKMLNNPELQADYMNALQPKAQRSKEQLEWLLTILKEKEEAITSLPPEERAEAIGQILGYTITILFGWDALLAGKLLWAGGKIAKGAVKGLGGSKWEGKIKQGAQSIYDFPDKVADKAASGAEKIADKITETARNMWPEVVTAEGVIIKGSDVASEVGRVNKMDINLNWGEWAIRISPNMLRDGLQKDMSFTEKLSLLKEYDKGLSDAAVAPFVKNNSENLKTVLETSGIKQYTEQVNTFKRWLLEKITARLDEFPKLNSKEKTELNEVIRGTVKLDEEFGKTLGEKVKMWMKTGDSFEITNTISRDCNFPLEHFAQKPKLLEELFTNINTFFDNVPTLHESMFKRWGVLEGKEEQRRVLEIIKGVEKLQETTRAEKINNLSLTSRIEIFNILNENRNNMLRINQILNDIRTNWFLNKHYE